MDQLILVKFSEHSSIYMINVAVHHSVEGQNDETDKMWKRLSNEGTKCQIDNVPNRQSVD